MPRSIRCSRGLTALALSGALVAGGAACGGSAAAGAGGQGGGAGSEAIAAARVLGHAEQGGALRAQAAHAAARAALPQVEPSPTTSAERQRFAKARFVANAGLAAGATYQWIIKPYQQGKFRKGASGRTFTLIKAGLAGAFAYNRLKAAVGNAQADPLLSKALAPLTAGIESLKEMGAKLRSGDIDAADITSFQNIINGVKDAGQSAGAPVKDQVPGVSELGG
ncbi:hypothetical protein C0216_24555 [Streptomyces globosus]|uniref:Lipoprotein n=1 Tax=Streptomyces globosus TaxID=68209 RepID=A0A344UA03_9ACTN|nr:hypothetical protein C0216_24555 [Streptomyces globosus]